MWHEKVPGHLGLESREEGFIFKVYCYGHDNGCLLSHFPFAFLASISSVLHNSPEARICGLISR